MKGFKKYKTKPRQIQAIYFDGSIESFLKISDLNTCYNVTFNYVNRYESCLIIQTFCGEIIVKAGDYIIKGIKGQLYSCKKQIFEQSYELI